MLFDNSLSLRIGFAPLLFSSARCHLIFPLRHVFAINPTESDEIRHFLRFSGGAPPASVLGPAHTPSLANPTHPFFDAQSAQRFSRSSAGGMPSGPFLTKIWAQPLLAAAPRLFSVLASIARLPFKAKYLYKIGFFRKFVAAGTRPSTDAHAVSGERRSPTLFPMHKVHKDFHGSWASSSFRSTSFSSARCQSNLASSPSLRQVFARNPTKSDEIRHLLLFFVGRASSTPPAFSSQIGFAPACLAMTCQP